MDLINWYANAVTDTMACKYILLLVRYAKPENHSRSIPYHSVAAVVSRVDKHIVRDGGSLSKASQIARWDNITAA